MSEYVHRVDERPRDAAGIAIGSARGVLDLVRLQPVRPVRVNDHARLAGEQLHERLQRGTGQPDANCHP